MVFDLFLSDAVAAEGVPLADTQTVTETPALDESYDVSAEKMLSQNLMLLAFLFFIFYFMLIRPQQQRIKVHKKMLSELSKGKKVITSGGIIGTIVKFEGDDVVIVEIAPEVKVRVARASISDTLDAASSGGANDN